MDTVIKVQNLDEAVYISHTGTTFGKGMNQTILLSNMDK